MTENKHVFIRNIYYMLSYAFSVLRRSDYQKMAGEAFENIHNLLAAILSQGIGHQVKQGLYRTYRSRKEDARFLRGKIDMTGSMRNQIARKRQLACEYDVLTENNLLNQILKTTVSLLLRDVRIDDVYRNQLKRILLFFSEVDTIPPNRIPWASIRFERSSRTYEMLIHLCRFILEGLLLTTERGEYRLAEFLDEQHMSRLYEKFIREYYRKEYPELEVKASRIPWGLDDGMDNLLPVMQSDITLQYEEKTLIIDAKYYSRTTQSYYGAHTIHSGHLYQIFTYVKNREYEWKERPHEVSGMLLYARTDESIQPDHTYQMSGNRIHVKTLDLNRDFGEIAGQLNEIADTFMGKSGVSLNEPADAERRVEKNRVLIQDE